MCCYAKWCSEYFTALILYFQRLPHRADNSPLPKKTTQANLTQARHPLFRKFPFFYFFIKETRTRLVTGKIDDFRVRFAGVPIPPFRYAEPKNRTTNSLSGAVNPLSGWAVAVGMD